MRICAALAGSASGMTTVGFLPPISELEALARACHAMMAHGRVGAGEGDRLSPLLASTSADPKSAPAALPGQARSRLREHRFWSRISTNAARSAGRPGRLVKHAIKAGGERRADLARRQRDREVPRRDREHNAGPVRAPNRQGFHRPEGLAGLAQRFAGIKTQVGGRALPFHGGGAQRLAFRARRGLAQPASALATIIRSAARSSTSTRFFPRAQRPGSAPAGGKARQRGSRIGGA